MSAFTSVIWEIDDEGTPDQKEAVIDKACALLVCLWKLSVSFPNILNKIKSYIDKFDDIFNEIAPPLTECGFHATVKMFNKTDKWVLKREKIGRICFRGCNSKPDKVFNEGFIHKYDSQCLKTIQDILLNEFLSDASKVAAFTTRLAVAARFPLPKYDGFDQLSYIVTVHVI